MKRHLKLVSVLVILAFFLFTQHTMAAGYGWGYKRNTDHQIPDIGKYNEILKKYGAYYADDSGDKDIYLTFDNGYEEGYTDEVLNILKEEKVPATFFITGHYVKEEPELVKRMANEGHIIGNHSYHHPDFTIISKDSIKEELDTLETAVADITDQKKLRYLRPPRGTFSQDTLKWTNELGYTHVFWSLAFQDWKTDSQKGWKYAYDEIIEQLHPGAIVLLHAVSSDNQEALSAVIKEAKKQGYQFKSLDDLMVKDILPKGILEL